MAEALASVMMTTTMLALLRSSTLMTWQMRPPAGSLTLMGCTLTIHRRASFQYSCILADVLDGPWESIHRALQRAETGDFNVL